MAAAEVVIPAGVTERYAAQGDGALLWLRELPRVMRSVADGWGVTLGYVLDRPTDAVVARGLRDGRPVVLKFWPPDAVGFDREVAVLTAADGRGYGVLLAVDADARALLLESLGEPLGRQSADRTPESGLDLMAAVLETAWRVPLSAGVPDGEVTEANRLLQLIERLPQPVGVPDCTAAIKRAGLYADQRAYGTHSAPVLTHGRLVLDSFRPVVAPRPGAPRDHVLIEPYGLVCEPEYDLGSLVAEANRAALEAEDPVVAVRGWCAHLAGVTGTDAEAIWQWSLLLRLARGLQLVNGPTPLAGRMHLQTVNALVVRLRG